MSRHTISPEALMDLRRQLDTLPPRSAERRHRIPEAAAFYGISEPTRYRLLRQRRHPRSLGRADRDAPRVLPKAELERYLELIAALKVRTANGKGRPLSTRAAIRVLEDYGLDTPFGTRARAQRAPQDADGQRVSESLGLGLADLAAGTPSGAFPSSVQQ